MKARNDLSRWNRAGLDRFRYIDGNAVEYLELLRQRLVEQFADADSGLCEWLNPPEPIPPNEAEVEAETLMERQQRLSHRHQRILETYHQDRRDWAWEISRSFARCCHILTEHSDAYANEGFLGTATQWEHVRRLVEMLDYHPAPPASAATWLSFTAKQDKSGLVGKGFQIKNSPPTGGDKVIFETLADLTIDYELNALRPKGWDQSELPAVDDDGGDDTGGEVVFSTLANSLASIIQGVGDARAAKLASWSGIDDFKVRDFLDIDPANMAGLDISEVRLREYKAKATVLSYFELESGWSDIAEWLLPDIVTASPATLSEITAMPLDKVSALQLRIELVAAYLDQPVFDSSKLRDLLAPAATAPAASVETYWVAPKKPRVDPGQVAMVFHHSDDQAEAATIAAVDADSGVIDLLPSPVQFSWGRWPLGEISLRVVPRWKKECWLNGSNVIRTTEAHGLSEGAYIAWLQDRVWYFADVIESDKRGLRINFDGNLPRPGTPLYEAYPLESDVMATTLEAIGLAGGGQPNVEAVTFPDPEDPIFWMPEDFSNPGSVPPGVPPASLSFGSFLFPTPLLPMDLVKAAVELMLSMGVMVIPSTGEVVFKSLPGLLDEDQIFRDLKDIVAWRDDLVTEVQRKAAFKEMLEPPEVDPVVLFQQILDNLEEKGPLIAVQNNPPVKAVVDLSYPPYMFDSNPDKVNSGDWVVGSFTDGNRALRVNAVNEYAAGDNSETFSLSFENLVGNEGELLKVYADFRGELVPESATFNELPIEPEGIELESVPESLAVGRDVLLNADGKEPVAAKIQRIDGNRIVTTPAPEGFRKGELVINANVIMIGHGESKPAKILGSGDATRSNQEFVLEVEALSFVPDATQSAGVAAAIDVIVGDRVWEQVSTMKDSAPDDHHYAIRMTEAGYVKILFGDGKYGRRLPSGKNNVRVSYRVGSGIAGNVPARSLEKPVNPHPLVDAVTQSQPATGGGDMEDLHSLRENAPPTLLALKRAVSLSDFSHLASSQSSIWQAKAYNEILHGGRTENVKVVIVAAGGVSSDDIKNDLGNFLQQHALPGVRVCIGDFVPIRFDLTITIRVDSAAYIPSEVQSAVEAALSAHFSLRNRELGQHLYLSEVYKVVEAVEGVENSICLLNDDEQLRVIQAANQSTVIHLDLEAGSTLVVSAEEYQP